MVTADPDSPKPSRTSRRRERMFRRRHVQNWIWLSVLAFAAIPVFTTGPSLPGSRLEAGTDLLGLLLLLLGLAIRVAARGWKHEAPGRNLVTDGPYGYVRHPLYVGSFLIGLGLCAIAGSLPLTAIFCLCFGFSHAAAIRSEEATLDRHWPVEAAQYRAQVGALWPRLAALRSSGRFWPRRLGEALAREADALCLWLLAAIALEFREEVFFDQGLQHHRAEAGSLLALALAIGLGWCYLRAHAQKRRTAGNLVAP